MGKLSSYLECTVDMYFSHTLPTLWTLQPIPQEISLLEGDVPPDRLTLGP